EMPAFTDVLEPVQMKQVAAYVWGLTNTASDPALAAAGKQVFLDNCAACHGEGARGKVEMGAPDLADAIWLKARGEDAIARQVASPKHGVMPAWAGRLGDTTVKELSVFVHSLGGGT
ncbi:cytochrome c, mono- and diheme variants family, partial [Rhizobium leguminosarum bv. trifolii WSM2012]